MSTDHFTVPVDVDALAINPHAHYVCKEMYGYAVLPDGSRRTLHPHSGLEFRLAAAIHVCRAVRLPAGTRVEMEFTYDNSAANPRNPHHPPQRVRGVRAAKTRWRGSISRSRRSTRTMPRSCRRHCGGR